MAEEQRQILIDVELENRDFEQELGNVNKQLKANRDTIKELSKDYQNNAKEIAKLELANKDLSAQKREIIKDQKTEANSLNALRRQLAKLTAERNNLDTSLEGNAQKFQELQDEILQTTTKIKGFEQAGGDFRRNVGNYTGSLEDAISASGGFGGEIVGIKERLISLANPITGVVAALGTLFTAYAKTGRGSADLLRATDRLSSAFNQLGQASANAFGNNFIDNIIRTLQSRFLGLASLINSDIQVAINEQLREFELIQLESDAEAKRLLDLAEKRRQKRDDERLSIEERTKANEDLLFTINEREQAQLDTIEKRINLLKTALALDEDNLDLQLQLKQAELERRDIQEEAQGFRSEQLINENSLLREQTENQLRLLEAQIQSELAVLEDGNQRKLDLELQLIEKRRQLLIEAAGEDATILAAINQEADNERLEKFRTFQENQVQLETIKAKKVEGIAEEETKKTISLVGKQIKADKQAALERQKTAEQTAAIKAQLEAQLLNNTLSILGSIDESGKASALLQIGLSAAQGVAAAVKAGAGVPFPGNLLAIGAGVSSVLAAIGQARQIFSQSAGAGSGASGAGSAPRVNTGLVSSEGGGNIGLINAGLLSQFSEPLRSEQRTAQSTANAVSNLGPIFVAVTDINKGQRRLNAKVTEARLG